MMFRRSGIATLSYLGLLCMVVPDAKAQDIHVTESHPAASAVIEGDSTEFFVRFDKPIDQIHALLTITRDGKLVETLHPREGSAENVLFARAPTLARGDYKLYWSVRTMAGADAAQGDIPFTVGGSK
jgi:methionine-rich copper-binding protein CopC